MRANKGGGIPVPRQHPCTEQRRTGPIGGLRGWRWIGLGMALTVVWVHLRATPGVPSGRSQWLPCLALLAALGFVWLNRRYRGLWLLSFGAALNLLVMAANVGLMPIALNTAEALAGAVGQREHATKSLTHSKDSIIPGARARFPFLDDWHTAAAGIEQARR